MNRRAFALGSVMVGLVAVIAVALRSFAEAAFVSAYGTDELAWLPIASAGGFALATLGYDALTRLAHARAVDLGLLATLGVVAAAAPSLLAAGAPPGVLVVALTATPQVAALALWNRVADTVAGRDARRMLPRAGAAVTAGGAVAGLGAGALIPRLGLTWIPYAAAAVTLVVLAIAAAQERALGGSSPGAASAHGGGGELSPVMRRLLGALVVVALLEAIVATVVDLQFLATVKSRYTGDAVAIALALFYGGTNALLFVLQSAAVPRLLVTRSLPFTAAIHPLVVVASYLGFVAAPGFVAIAGTRTGDQVLRLATSRTSQEVSLSALPPAPRARWKVLLRGAVWPAGAAAAGLALLVAGSSALTAQLSAVAIAIAIAWALAARIAARRFQTALAAPLGIRAAQREDPRRIDLATLESWTRATADPAHAALARSALARARVEISDLADHLRDDSADVRAALYDQLAREPAPALRGELRAAVAIEDDDRALAAGIVALALHDDTTGIARGKARSGLSRDVDDAVARAELLVAEAPAWSQIAPWCASDPRSVITLARRGAAVDGVRDAIGDPALRAGALAVIACAPNERTLPLLGDALAAGEPSASAAIAGIDARGAGELAALAAQLAPPARLALARALAGAASGSAALAVLLDDRDPEVAHAALRSALAIARGGGELPAARIAAGHQAALAALTTHLDVRDARADATAIARAELEIATRRCVARLLWASALRAAAAGRDPAPVAATARHLVGAREADRRRALDVLQELAANADVLGAVERWLRPPSEPGVKPELAAHDAWLASLLAGELAALEPVLGELRRPALLASLAGPALAALAARTQRRTVDGALFRIGDPGDDMFVVASGELLATRDGTPDRRITAGEVVGELAVLTHAPRAATVTADGTAVVLAIDRGAFSEAARRAPELVLGLAAMLAGWLAPNRPDVL